jgi:hypothetical protein
MDIELGLRQKKYLNNIQELFISMRSHLYIKNTILMNKLMKYSFLHLDNSYLLGMMCKQWMLLRQNSFQLSKLSILEH